MLPRGPTFLSIPGEHISLLTRLRADAPAAPAIAVVAPPREGFPHIAGSTQINVRDELGRELSAAAPAADRLLWEETTEEVNDPRKHGSLLSVTLLRIERGCDTYPRIEVKPLSVKKRGCCPRSPKTPGAQPTALQGILDLLQAITQLKDAISQRTDKHGSRTGKSCCCQQPESTNNVGSGIVCFNSHPCEQLNAVHNGGHEDSSEDEDHHCDDHHPDVLVDSVIVHFLSPSSCCWVDHQLRTLRAAYLTLSMSTL